MKMCSKQIITIEQNNDRPFNFQPQCNLIFPVKKERINSDAHQSLTEPKGPKM